MQSAHKVHVSFSHSIAATAIVPVSVHVVMLGVVMFFMGMALGGLDNGRYLQEQVSSGRQVE